MNTVKNIVVGLLVLAGLAVGGFLAYVAGAMVLAILGVIVSVVVVALIVLGVVSGVGDLTGSRRDVCVRNALCKYVRES